MGLGGDRDNSIHDEAAKDDWQYDGQRVHRSDLQQINETGH